MRLLKIYRAMFTTFMAIHLQYRASLLIWLLAFFIEPVVYLAVWMAVANAQGGMVGGFSAPDFAAYFIASMMIHHATFDWHMWEFEFRIRNGALSPLLLKPVHPIHGDLIENINYKLLTLPVMVVAAVVLILTFKPSIQADAAHLALGALAVLLGFAVRFTFDWALALVAFWTTRVNAINQAYFTLMVFFSGRLAPLSLLPEPMQQIADFLPFQWVIAFPISLILGRIPLEQAWSGFAMQLLWICIGGTVLALTWRAGLKRYSAVGA